MVSPDERRRDDIARLTAELKEWEERKQRARAAQGPPLLRNRNRFFNGLLHGDLNTLEREDGLRQEIRRCDEQIARISSRLSALGGEVDQPRGEVPGDDLDRRALSAKVRRARKSRSSADHLLSVIEKTRKRIARAGRHRRRDDAGRSVVDQDAKEIARLFGDVRRAVAKLTARTPSGVPVRLDSASRLFVQFSGSAVDEKVRAKEYKDATHVLDALAREVKPLRGTLAFREADAKRIRRASRR